MNRLPRTHTNCQTNLGSDCPDNNGLSTHFHEQEPSFKTGPSDAQDNPFTSFLPWHSEKFNIVQKSTEEIRLLKEREGLAIGPQYIGEWGSNLKAAWNTWDKNASDSARKIAFTRLLVGEDSAGNNWNSLLRNQSHEFLASYAELLIHFRALLDPLILKNLIEHNLSSLYRELRQGSSPFTAQIEIHALLLFFSDHPEPSEATRTAVLETLQKHARLALEGRMSDVGRWAGLKAMEKHLQQGNPLSEDEAKEECAGAMRTLLCGRQRTELRWLDNSLDGIVGWYSTHHGLASEDLAATRRAITEAMFPDAQHCQPPFEIYRAFNHPAEELFPTRRIPQKIEGPSKASLYKLPDETQALEKN